MLSIEAFDFLSNRGNAEAITIRSGIRAARLL